MINLSPRRIFLAVVPKLLFLAVIFSFGTTVFAGPIIIYGDSQDSDDVQRQIVQEIMQKKPSIVLRVGDMVNDGRDAQQWNTLNDISAELLKTTEYFPALGNHEGGSPLYFKNFSQIKNRRWYSIDRQGIHFVILDSNSRMDKESRQYAWLESDLNQLAPQTKFLLVIFHHPIFTSGSHTPDEKNLRSLLLPLFEKYGVGATFSGHDHNYQRFVYQGIDFIVTGGGGSRLRDQAEDRPYLIKFKKTYHFCVLTPEKDSIKVEVLDLNSNRIDEFSIPSITTQRARQLQKKH